MDYKNEDFTVYKWIFKNISNCFNVIWIVFNNDTYIGCIQSNITKQKYMKDWSYGQADNQTNAPILLNRYFLFITV